MMKAINTLDNNALTTKAKWEAIWAGVKLPFVNEPGDDMKEQLETYLPHNGLYSFIEIGCAPGGWMAYFNKHFGYRVAGLEYAEAAAKATQLNMKLLAIDAEVFVQDFFSIDCTKSKYDIVFSAGFIEHFRDPLPVMDRIVALSQRYVVTIVPNLFGVNGCIGKTIQSKVYAEHIQIDVSALSGLHVSCGLKTLFCDYAGGARLIAPGAHNEFFNKHRYCARIVNTPAGVFNRLSTYVGAFLHYIPRSRLLSDSLLYIGLKE